MEDLVTVIIPVYNVASFLSEAIDSVLSQTYDNLAIIIIDDGFYDGSEDICDEYQTKDDRIVVIHQSYRGLSTTRNIGLEMATGEAIAVGDSDDVYHPFLSKECCRQKTKTAQIW